MNSDDKSRVMDILNDIILASYTPDNMINLMPEETLGFVEREVRKVLAIIERQPVDHR